MEYFLVSCIFSQAKLIIFKPWTNWWIWRLHLDQCRLFLKDESPSKFSISCSLSGFTAHSSPLWADRSHVCESSQVWNHCSCIINALSRAPAPQLGGGAGAAGPSYRWQSPASQTASSRWPLETAREPTDQRPAGGEEHMNNKSHCRYDSKYQWFKY